MSRKVKLRGRVLMRRRSRASPSLSHDLFISLLNPPALSPPAGHHPERSRAAVLPSRLCRHVLLSRPQQTPPPPQGWVPTYLGLRGQTLAVATVRPPPRRQRARENSKEAGRSCNPAVLASAVAAALITRFPLDLKSPANEPKTRIFSPPSTPRGRASIDRPRSASCVVFLTLGGIMGC